MALLLAACVARRLPGGQSCPDHGGAPWNEYRSAHFVVYSDLDPAHVAPLVEGLESIRALVLAALGAADREIPGRLRVVAPAHARVFGSIAPPGVLGYHLVSGLGEPTIVLHGPSILRDPEVLAHELAHHLSRHLYPRQPHWFTEGLAQFVSTVASPEPEGRGRVGGVPGFRRTRCAGAPPVTTRQLLAWPDVLPTDTQAALSLWSWVFYHWLWSERHEALQAFERRLATGDDPALAWAATFPDLGPAAGDLPGVDAALRRHCARPELPAQQVRGADAADAAFTATPLRSADVHVLLIEARGFWTLSRHALTAGATEAALAEASRVDILEALHEDPAQPRAVSRLAELDGKPAAGPLREASRARPNDWSVWYLLGDALEDEEDPAGAEAAYRQAARLNPDNAPTQNNLAWLLARAGRPEEARGFAERAAGLAPWDPSILDTLALVRDGLGACPEALRLQRTAVSLLEGGGSLNVVREGNAQELKERLGEYEARCGAQPARPAAGSQ